MISSEQHRTTGWFTMSKQKFSASMSRSQGRKSWCVIFRHPLRTGSDGRPGLRVRRGLGTDDEVKARELVTQMNALLADSSFWRLSARADASRKFDKRIVATFYDNIKTKTEDPWVVREEVIPLPTDKDGYAKVLFVGATGAGKTTLLRQLIGSHPERDRFPSISTAKTTIFDTEIVLSPSEYRCVVSFLPRDRVRSYIEECVVAAVSAAAEGSPQETTLRRLLEHSEQRFRLSYLLGTLTKSQNGEDEDIEDDEFDAEMLRENTDDGEPPEVEEKQRILMENRLRGFLKRVIDIATNLRGDLAEQLEVDPANLKHDEHDAFLELVEDLLYDSERAQSLIDDILDEVESKFPLLEEGTYECERLDWPCRWFFKTTDRKLFIKTINRFSSNYAPNFGQLLAPVVQGLRVSGPFRPSWYSKDDKIPKLVFIDGEGLGHTPASASTLPTTITRRYETADVILLVDSATQPMQAAAQAVLRSAAAGGHETKLSVAFTHFDQVKGDNLPSASDRKNHVRASLESAIDSVDNAIAANAGRKLRRCLEERTYFLSRIDKPLSEKAHGTRKEFSNLVKMFEISILPPETPHVVPVYDLANLVLCILQATEQFQEHWSARLGLAYKLGVSKEHWTRIKALSRRFASDRKSVV